jgi:hypothetical protein
VVPHALPAPHAGVFNLSRNVANRAYKNSTGTLPMTSTMRHPLPLGTTWVVRLHRRRPFRVLHGHALGLGGLFGPSPPCPCPCRRTHGVALPRADPAAPSLHRAGAGAGDSDSGPSSCCCCCRRFQPATPHAAFGELAGERVDGLGRRGSGRQPRVSSKLHFRFVVNVA